MDKKMRVRFAPSPTGNIHIGNVRAALLNWLCARHFGGDFILRIEDTDAERSTEESEQGIIEQLQWFGIDWDEGPVKGGEYGPYRQSERKELYAEHVKKLIDSGNAYHCYCTTEELEESKGEGYSGRCRDLSTEQIQKFKEEGRNPVVRFNVPVGEIVLKDLVQGTITFDGANYTDFVIQRQDGSSPYNFAAVIDDSTMKISHVIRGNDHVSNTPKQILMYNALGYPLPEFAHIPMITGQDGVRLSKRHGHTSASEFREAGYLPEALINYLSLLSWSSESGDEVLSVDRLIKEFDISRVNNSPAAFDKVKLNWMNGVYIRDLDIEKLVDLVEPYMAEAGFAEPDKEKFSKIIASVKNNAETLADFPKYAEIFFKDNVNIEGEEKEIVSSDSSQSVFKLLYEKLGELDGLKVEDFLAVMKIVQKETGVKGKDLWMPVRAALTGQLHGPELPVVLEIFGLEKCRNLIKSVIQ